MTAFDVIVRDGLMVDGTGGRPSLPMSASSVTGSRRSVICRASGRRGDRRGGAIGDARLRRHPHASRRAARVGPDRESLVLARRHDRRDGELRVTFAPCRPDDRTYLAEMMESVEDIPAAAILSGLPWDWQTYGEYLASVDRMPKGVNVGGMVGHARRYYDGWEPERGAGDRGRRGRDV